MVKKGYKKPWIEETMPVELVLMGEMSEKSVSGWVNWNQNWNNSWLNTGAVSSQKSRTSD